MRRAGMARALGYGTLAVGTLDILDAFIFFGLRSGAPPQRILQGIAGGLPSAFAAAAARAEPSRLAH